MAIHLGCETRGEGLAAFDQNTGNHSSTAPGRSSGWGHCRTPSETTGVTQSASRQRPGSACSCQLLPTNRHVAGSSSRSSNGPQASCQPRGHCSLHMASHGFWPISGREDPTLIYCNAAPTLSAPETTALSLPTLDSGIPRTSTRSNYTEVHQGYIPRIVSALSGLCPLTSGLTGWCKQGNEAQKTAGHIAEPRLNGTNS